MASRALLFPGQGAHSLQMVQALKEHPCFPQRYEYACDVLHQDVVEEVGSVDDGAASWSNCHASILTVLGSVLALDTWAERNSEEIFVAGYSVGQWTALYAAGALDLETLFRVVFTRAGCMDRAAGDGGLIGCVGLALEAVEGICNELRERNCSVGIANYNCPGNYTLYASAKDLDVLEAHLRGLGPRSLVRLNVNGPWHSGLLQEAVVEFHTYLENELDLVIEPNKVIDNVTGGFLPVELGSLRRTLAEHLASPVQWEAGIRNLLQAGCNEFVELGYGKLLTKFGFFIDRTAVYTSCP